MDIEHTVFLCWEYFVNIRDRISESKPVEIMYVTIDAYLLKCLCCDVTATNT
jgi:hypothetical protein